MKGKGLLLKVGLICLTIVLVIVTLMAGCSTEPATEMKVRLAAYCSNAGFMGSELQWFADELERRTGDRLDVEVFWAGSLGKTTELPEVCTTGVAEMVFTIYNYSPEKFPFESFTSIGFGISEPEYQASWAADGYREIMKKYPILQEREWVGNNTKLIAITDYYPGGIYSTKPLSSVEDLKGLKIRCSSATVDLFRDFGAETFPIAGAEVADALQRGIIDAAVGTPEAANRYGHVPDICKYWWQTGIPGQSNGPLLTANLDFWNGLDTSTQKTLEKLGLEWEERFNKGLETDTEVFIENFKASGVNYIVIDPEVREELIENYWRKYYDQYVEKVEGLGWSNAREILDDFCRISDFNVDNY